MCVYICIYICICLYVYVNIDRLVCVFINVSHVYMHSQTHMVVGVVGI